MHTQVCPHPAEVRAAWLAVEIHSSHLAANAQESTHHDGGHGHKQENQILPFISGGSGEHRCCLSPTVHLVDEAIAAEYYADLMH